MDSSPNVPLETADGSGVSRQGDAVSAAVPAGFVRVCCVRDLIDALASLPLPVGGPGLIGEVGELEELKSLIAGRQARDAVAFDLDQRHAQAAAGVPASEQGRGGRAGRPGPAGVPS